MNAVLVTSYVILPKFVIFVVIFWDINSIVHQRLIVMVQGNLRFFYIKGVLDLPVINLSLVRYVCR